VVRFFSRAPARDLWRLVERHHSLDYAWVRRPTVACAVTYTSAAAACGAPQSQLGGGGSAH